MYIKISVTYGFLNIGRLSRLQSFLLYLACTQFGSNLLSSSMVAMLAFLSGIDSLSSSSSISRASNLSTKRSSACGCARTRRPIGSAVLEAESPWPSPRVTNWVCRRKRISPVVSSREVSQKSSLDVCKGGYDGYRGEKKRGCPYMFPDCRSDRLRYMRVAPIDLLIW
jgi:hypothetical protein